MGDRLITRGIEVGRPSHQQPEKIYCDICDAPLSKYRDASERICAFHPKTLRPKGSYAMVELTKAMREGKKALEELDYREVGMAGNNHLVMEHPYAGRLYVSGTPTTVEGEVLRKVQKARKQISQINGNVAEFVDFLRRKYQVPEDASVVAQTTLVKEMRQWAANRPPGAERINLATFPAPVLKGGYVRMLKRGQGKNPSTIEILGQRYVAPEDTKEPTNADKAEQVEAATKSEPICGESHPTFPGVWCTEPPKHNGMHMSEAVESGWFTAKDELQPVVPYYSKAAQVAAEAEPAPKVEPELTPGMEKATKEGEKIAYAAMAKSTPAEQPVGVSTDTEPLVAIDTSEVESQKTPQGAEEILAAMRNLLAPDAYTNEQTLAQCKEMVRELKNDLDAAYEKVYNLERILRM